MRKRGPVLAVLLLTACAGGNRVDGPPPEAPETMKLRSEEAEAGGRVPAHSTCDGLDVPVKLEWSGTPSGTRELAILVEDPDAKGGTFVHWVVYEIDRKVKSSFGPPSGAQQGANSFGRGGWRGPCPPEGDQPHRYIFTVYALGKPSGLRPNAHPRRARKAFEGALARGTLMLRYGR